MTDLNTIISWFEGIHYKANPNEPVTITMSYDTCTDILSALTIARNDISRLKEENEKALYYSCRKEYEFGPDGRD